MTSPRQGPAAGANSAPQSRNHLLAVIPRGGFKVEGPT